MAVEVSVDTGSSDVVVSDNTINVDVVCYPFGTGGGDATPFYIRPTAMDISVGGAVAGTTFDGTVQDALDAILYPYIEPSFTSFSLSGYSSLEVGASIPAGSQTFNFNIDTDENVQPSSVDIENVSDVVVLATGTENDNTETVTFPSPVTRTTPGSKTFRITASNTHLDSFSSNLNISWYFRLFYGESASTSLDEAAILALRANNLDTTLSGTYSMLAGDYKYWAIPTSWPQPSDWRLDGFVFPMEAPVLVNVTNAHGVSQDYNVYRSTNPTVGAVTIVVS